MIARPAYPVTQSDLVQLACDGKRSSFVLRDGLIPVEGETLPPDSLMHVKAQDGTVEKKIYDSVRSLISRSDATAADQTLQSKIGRRILRIHGRIAASNHVKVADVTEVFQKKIYRKSQIDPRFRTKDLPNGCALLQLAVHPSDRKITIDVFDPSTIGHGPEARGVLSTRDMHKLFDDLSRMMVQNTYVHAEKFLEPKFKLESFERGDIRFERSPDHGTYAYRAMSKNKTDLLGAVLLNDQFASVGLSAKMLAKRFNVEG